jgi:RHS repeat-associated protein
MLVPNRHGSMDNYRYGFNGKEKDDEVKGEGLQYDYGFRIYDTRIGKFLSQDPLFKSFPWYTPYQFAGNRPISSVDLDGLEELDVNIMRVNNDGTAILSITITDGSRLSSNDGKVIYNVYKPNGELAGRFSNEVPFSNAISEIFGGTPIGLPSLNDKTPLDPSHYQFPASVDTYKKYSENILSLGPNDVVILVNGQLHQKNSTFVEDGIVIEKLTMNAKLDGQPTATFSGNIGLNLKGAANDKINGKESTPLLFINDLVSKTESSILKSLEKYNQNSNDIKNITINLSPNLQEYIGGYEAIFKELQSKFPNATIKEDSTPSESGHYGISVEGKTFGEKLNETE